MIYDINKIENEVALRWGHQDYYLESADYDGKEMIQSELNDFEEQHPEFAYEQYYNL